MARGEATWPGLNKEGDVPLSRPPGFFRRCRDELVHGPDRKPLVGTLRPSDGQCRPQVADLDAWVAKLKAEKVTFLRQPFKIGGTRAVMIEGPSHEAIELVEVK